MGLAEVLLEAFALLLGGCTKRTSIAGVGRGSRLYKVVTYLFLFLPIPSGPGGKSRDTITQA